MRKPTAAAPDLPAPLARSVGFLLAKATQRAAEAMESALRPHSLKSRHYGVLVVLRERGPKSQQEVADLLAIDRTTMASVVDELEALGLAQRRPYPGNRRAHQVSLTERGAERLAELDGAVREADRALTAGLPAAEADELRRLVARVAFPERPPAPGRC